MDKSIDFMRLPDDKSLNISVLKIYIVEEDKAMDAGCPWIGWLAFLREEYVQQWTAIGWWYDDEGNPQTTGYVHKLTQWYWYHFLSFVFIL